MNPGKGGQSFLEELDARDLLEVAHKCARAAHVTVERMFSSDRCFPASRARAAFYAALIATGDWNPHAIGRLVGRHHSTITYALDRYASNQATSSPASGVVPVASPAPLASCKPSKSAVRSLRIVRND